jgi:hypothetical protein
MKRTRTTPFRPSAPPPPLLTPEMLEALESWAQQSAPPAPPVVNDKEKPLGHAIAELIFDIGVEVTKQAWKKTDPDSYALNRAAFALAPYWPAEDAWILNLTALLTAGYGVLQVADRLKRDARKSR